MSNNRKNYCSIQFRSNFRINFIDSSSFKIPNFSSNRHFPNEIEVSQKKKIGSQKEKKGKKEYFQIKTRRILPVQTKVSTSAPAFSLILQNDINILLIGTTGSGKSSLGNYILGHRCFTTSDLRKPCTQQVSRHEMIHHKGKTAFRINVYDTPGLNEPDAVMDLQHTREIFKKTIEMGHLNSILLCIPHNTRSDATFSETVGYYHKLFSPLFEKNQFLFF